MALDALLSLALPRQQSAAAFHTAQVDVIAQGHALDETTAVDVQYHFGLGVVLRSHTSGSSISSRLRMVGTWADRL